MVEVMGGLNHRMTTCKLGFLESDSEYTVFDWSFNRITLDYYACKIRVFNTYFKSLDIFGILGHALILTGIFSKS